MINRVVWLFIPVFLMYALSASAKNDITRGEQLFRAKKCAVCHPSGENILSKDHALIGKAFETRYSTDNALIAVIRQGLKSSNASMPAFDKQRLSDEELADVVAYIRTLGKKDKAATKKS